MIQSHSKISGLPYKTRVHKLEWKKHTDLLEERTKLVHWCHDNLGTPCWDTPTAPPTGDWQITNEVCYSPLIFTPVVHVKTLEDHVLVMLVWG
jgi:hypothetical protein